jgi:MSHA biogenesis protein MshQ
LAASAYTSVRVLANGALQFGADTGFMRTYTNTALPAGTAGARQRGCARPPQRRARSWSTGPT